MRIEHVALASLLSLSCASPASAEPTEIVVRVLAKDAKFIGHNEDSGGVQITLRNAETGAILAQGLVEGGRGQTERIMRTGRVRREILSEGASKFAATIDLTRPTLISVTAKGPMVLKDNAMTVTATQWVLPGKSINAGDGWVLEIPGFAVTLTDALPAAVRLAGNRAVIPIHAKITMADAHELEPGGIWDPAKFELKAMVEKAGKTLPATALTYAGQPGMFNGEIAVTEAGDYTVYVYAYDPANGNTGVVKVPLSVR
jgi:hypothetical protein